MRRLEGYGKSKRISERGEYCSNNLKINLVVLETM